MTEWAIWFVVGMVGVVIIRLGKGFITYRRTAKREHVRRPRMWPVPPINPASSTPDKPILTARILNTDNPDHPMRQGEWGKDLDSTPPRPAGAFVPTVTAVQTNEPQQSSARSEPFEAVERLNISINGYHATADHSADGLVLLSWQPNTPDSVVIQMMNRAQNHFRKTEHKA